MTVFASKEFTTEKLVIYNRKVTLGNGRHLENELGDRAANRFWVWGACW